MENSKLQRDIQKGLAFSYGLIDGGYTYADFPEDDSQMMYYIINYGYQPLTVVFLWMVVPEKGFAEKYCFRLYQLTSGDDYGIYGINLVARLALDGSPKFIYKNDDLDIGQISFWSDEFSSWLNKLMIKERERLRADQEG